MPSGRHLTGQPPTNSQASSAARVVEVTSWRCRTIAVMDLASSVGLGLDIAGAVVIAIGLLGSPATFALRATEFFGGSPHTAAAEAESRADGELGIPLLILGFLGQLIGLGVRTRAPVAVGTALAALAALVPLALWHWVWHPWRSKRLAVEIAHYSVANARQQPQRHDLPGLNVLASIGVGLGEPLCDGETDDSYVARVFDVTNTQESEPE
jgi:hypothetical protein